MVKLPQSEISRRRWLQSSAAATTAFAFRPPCLFAETPPRPKLSFVVVSDTHLGYRNKAAAARLWDRTAKAIGESSAKFVLHLGDVVDGGREEQYPLYLKAREQIAQPVYEIPGNHDPQPFFEKYLRKPVDHVVDYDWLRFLLLNNSRRDSHDGFLSDKQLDWIEDHCRQAGRDQKYVMIAMHIPAHSNRHPDRGWYVKPDHGQTRLYEILRAHRSRVLGLMHGHFHNGIRGWEDHGTLQEICFPSALYNRNRRLEAPKAPGYNVQEFRPGFTHIEIDKGVMTMRFQVVGQDSPATLRKALGQSPG